MRLALPLAVLALVSGCKEEPAKPAAPATSASAPASTSVVAAASSSAPTVASASAPASASASAAPAEKTCEVEIFGKVKGAPPKSRVVVYVAQDDCLADDAHILGHLDVVADPTAKDGWKFMIEVFPKWGTDITICAAAYGEGANGAEHYAKAKGKFHAEAEGEVTFNEVALELVKGKLKTFPKDWDKSLGAQPPSGKTQGPPKK